MEAQENYSLQFDTLPKQVWHLITGGHKFESVTRVS